MFLNFFLGASTLSVWCATAAFGNMIDRSSEERVVEMVQDENSHSTQTLQFQPSPACWVNAMKVVQELEVAVSCPTLERQLVLDSTFCQGMTYEHQKALALELTKCHMDSVGRPLYIVSCEQQKLLDANTLRTCLANLDDTSLNAYTHFFTYVNQNCIRLSHEVVSAHYREIVAQLSETSKLAVESMSDILSQQELILTSQANASGLIMDRMTYVLTNQDMLVASQKSSLQRQEEDRKDMQRHKHDVNKMSVALSTMTNAIEPLVGIKAIIVRLNKEFTWFTSFLYFLGTINTAWLLTMIKPFRCSRRFISGIILSEVLAEFALHWMIQEGLLLETDGTNGISMLRSFAFYFECGTYLLGLLSYFIMPQEEESISLEEMHTHYTYLLHRLEERTDIAVAEQVDRGIRLVEMLGAIKKEMTSSGQFSVSRVRNTNQTPAPSSVGDIWDGDHVGENMSRIENANVPAEMGQINVTYHEPHALKHACQRPLDLMIPQVHTPFAAKTCVEVGNIALRKDVRIHRTKKRLAERHGESVNSGEPEIKKKRHEQ